MESVLSLKKNSIIGTKHEQMVCQNWGGGKSRV